MKQRNGYNREDFNWKPSGSTEDEMEFVGIDGSDAPTFANDGPVYENWTETQQDEGWTRVDTTFS